MTPKLNKEDRLKIVEHVKKGEPVSKVCAEAGISRVLFYRWYKKYKEEGARGLNPGKAGRPKLPGTLKKVKEYTILSPHARSLMVKEVIEQNQDPSEVAKRYNISRVTLYKWIERYKRDIAKGAEPDMSSRKPYIERYFRQVPERHELAVIQLVEQHPEWGIRRIVANLPKVAGLPIVGHHGVQNILDRHNLSTYELRLAYAGSRITPVTKGIGEVLVKVSEFFRIPPENRRVFIRAFTGISLGLFSLIAILGVIGYFARSFTQVSGASPLGLSFSAVSLLMGTIFLLYSFKYYFSIALVLSFSQTQKGVERKRGVGLTPDLSHVKLLDRPYVSVHIPFYNEKYVVERVMEAASGFDYPEYEVILCDDSTDETSEIISNYLHANGGKVEKRSGDGWELQSAEIKPGVTFKHLHRTTRGGYKGGALDLALKLADPRTEYVSIFDADFVPYPDTLELFLKYFQVEGYKPEIAAVQGYQWHVLNKSENWITRGVRTEYSGSYVIERSGTEIYGGLKQISGSVYMIKKDVLQKIGWGTSITEDFELTLKLYDAGYKVLYTPYIQAPAECVSTIRRLVRQRMRWAEGHSANIKKMFFNLLRSPKLSLAEKFEFAYLSPYYLQAFFFLVGTVCWLLSEAVFKTKLPFWTELWGWSLVLTNVISLPLLNTVGMFLEESRDRDYLGLASFVALSYILVPFQAYASVKGLLEDKEGPWFRTPKTGRITDVFRRGKFYKFISGILPGRIAEPAQTPVVTAHQETHDLTANYYIGLATANSRFNNFSIPRKENRFIGKAVLISVLIISLLVNNFALFAEPVKAYDSSWLYRKKLTISGTTAGTQTNFQMEIDVFSGSGTDSGKNVYCSSHCNNDFSDVRFVKSDGTTDLDYWRKSYVSGTSAVFWVEVDSIPASPSTVDIYWYYGNSSATTTSNGGNTFDFFDDFSGDLSKWTIDPANTDKVSTSSGALRHDPDSTQSRNSYFDTRLRTTDYKITDGVIEYSVYLAGSSSSSPRIIHQLGWRVNSNDFTNGYVWRVQNSAADGGHLKLTSGSWAVFGTAFNATAGNAWHTVKEVVSGTTFTGSVDGGSTYSGTDSTKQTADYLVSHVHGVSLDASSYVLVDDIRVRKYASPEPGYSSWGAEEQVPEMTILFIPLALAIPFLVNRLKRRKEKAVVYAK